VSALNVGLGEYDIGWEDPAGSLVRAEAVVSRAADQGAQLVALPEMCITGFSMDSGRLAEPLDGPSILALREMASRHGVHLLAGAATREEQCYNSALLIDSSGEIVGDYRKQRLFAYAGETNHYAAGTGPLVAEVNGVRIAPFVCFDLRFPELFREVGPRVDAIVLIASWPAARRAHWDVLVRARAIENQCYMVAVNRIGEGGGLAYDGGSVAYTPWGDRIGGAGEVVQIDPAEVTRIRAAYPFAGV
jgi:omega-amidase